MKRFTDTDKWRDPWFRNLTSAAKQLWGYLLDQCDKIGLVQIDFALASADCGQKINKIHLGELGDRIQDCGNGKHFIPKFIYFQYGELTESCPPHRPVINLVDLHGLVRVGLAYRYPNARVTPVLLNSNGLEESAYPSATLALGYKTRRGKEKEEGVQGEILPKELPEHIRSARVLNMWGQWMNHRRAFKKPKHWAVLFNAQVDFLSEHTEPQVFNILQTSVMNGYQGLFPPKNNENNGKHPPQRIDRSIGTANEGTAHLYEGLGRVAKTPDVQRSGT